MAWLKGRPSASCENSELSLPEELAVADGFEIMARVEDVSGDLITPGNIACVKYTIYRADDGDELVAVPGHEDVELCCRDVVFDTPRTDDMWGMGPGYNFAFAVAWTCDLGRRYDVRVRFQPMPGCGDVCDLRNLLEPIDLPTE
jgi:hypothetical protein